MNHESAPEMATRYDASATETKWYACWEVAGLFRPTGDGEPYTITIPPPNITGSLHMGHALCYSLQDALGRYQRLRGKRVLILPGQDHAGIATQSVVDKNLKKEGSSAAKIGRDAFLEKVWEWRAYSGGEILNGLRRFGCAFDWSRERFTLDEGYAEAVLRIFIDWYDRGLIVRGKRVVNWDPKLKTSVSDIETVRVPSAGKLYHVRYDLADGTGAITVATTRPETILADVAVAVHPSDDRYRSFVGKELIAPLTGRRIPVIADPYVERDFGTGALKITPAHDANDYQVGVRHGLPMPVAFDDAARIRTEELLEGLSPEAIERLKEFEGLDRKEARDRFAAALEKDGLLEKVEDHAVSLVVSDRSGETIEPLLSEQWFCDQAALAAPVIEAVRSGEVKFHPERYDRIFLDWMENLREWCVSRQLWWGHRIPVYYTADGEAFPGLSWDDAQARAGDKTIVRQDDDVLDTWFSSGLWPFATLGWPLETDDLKEFYPTSVLVTDRNIINLWVARMLMTGYDAMGAKPFSDVMIYATVLTEDGRRMSKSLGTGVDPIAVIEEVGADALRWFLASQTGENQDLRYRPASVVESRNWANKVWNSARFIVASAASGGVSDPARVGSGEDSVAVNPDLILKRRGANLPHWTAGGGTYAVTYRLADSVPAHVVEEWRAEREHLARLEDGGPAQAEMRFEKQKLFSAKVDTFLDSAQGDCVLARPEIAAIVEESLRFGDGHCYDLLAYAIMPNHVHAVVRPRDGEPLEKILHTWKSFTANRINDATGREGAVWQKESYDHLVRNERDLIRQIEYVLRNPEKAGGRGVSWSAVPTLAGSDTPPLAAEATLGATEPVDRWLLARLTQTEATVRKAYDEFLFLDACAALRDFWWNDVCDRYIEVAKSRLQAGEAAPAALLRQALEAFLKMLHPIMPHLTEEIWSVVRPSRSPVSGTFEVPVKSSFETKVVSDTGDLEGRTTFLMAESWPVFPELPAEFAADVERVGRAFEIVRAARALRAELGLTPGKVAPTLRYEGDLEGVEGIVRSQAWFERLESGRPTEPAISATEGGVDLHLPVGGLVDAEKERARLGKEAEKLEAELAKMRARLENPQFVERAKPEALEKARADAADLESRLAKAWERAAMFG